MRRRDWGDDLLSVVIAMLFAVSVFALFLGLDQMLGAQ